MVTKLSITQKHDAGRHAINRNENCPACFPVLGPQLAALNRIAAEELRTPRRKYSPRQESYPATASCGHQVNVYPKALVKQMGARLCVKCLVATRAERVTA